MGQEIEDSRFTAEHFAEFRRRLARETDTLQEREGKAGQHPVPTPPQHAR